MLKRRKILVTTGTRAEYGILRPVLKKINDSKKLELLLVVTGTHNSKKYGMTINEIKKDKFKTLTEYLNENDYYTHADLINQLVVPKQGFDNFIIHDELNDDLAKRHKELLKKMSI